MAKTEGADPAEAFFALEQGMRRVIMAERRTNLLERQCAHRTIFQSGLHPEQIPLLDLIGSGRFRSQADLAKELGVSPAAVAVSIKRMTRAGLVEKQADSADQRQNTVTLTEKGREMGRRAREGFVALKHRQYQGFSTEELSQLITFIERVGDNLEQYRQELDERE